MIRAGFVVRRRFTERGEQRRGQVEDPFDVRVDHAVPAGLGKLLERGTPRRAGVVDEDAERLGALTHLSGERSRPLRRGQVRRDRLAAAERAQLLGGGEQLRLLAG